MPKISILWSNSFLRNYDFLDPSTSSHTVRMYGDCHVIARIQTQFFSDAVISALKTVRGRLVFGTLI